MTPLEWYPNRLSKIQTVWHRAVGIYKDIHAFRLMDYLYGHTKFVRTRTVSVCWLLQPSSISVCTFLISNKLLHMAATNCTDGGHYNTHEVIAMRILYYINFVDTQWRLYWNLVGQKRAWMDGLLAESAADAPNRGSVFKFEEFQKLITTMYNRACNSAFPVWVLYRFIAVSLLLGALRSKQFKRFREGGLEAIEYVRENRDVDHLLYSYLCNDILLYNVIFRA